AEAVRNTGTDCRVWMQLNHPGKQSPSLLSKQPVAPSAVPLGGAVGKAFNTPRALTHDEILAIIERFATSAQLAEKAGFHGVQIHGAHGYLVSQFLSPHHNRREDDWGGSAEKRRRFVMAVYTAIRAKTSDNFTVAIKLNSADFQRGGFTEEESLEVVAQLGKAGIDLIEISGGTYEKPAMVGPPKKASTQAREAYFLAFAAKARKATDVPLAVTGGFRSTAGMQDALDSGATDLIGLARPLAVYPDLPKHLFADPDYRVTLQRPSTGMKGLDAVFALDVSWYERQIALLAAGKEPNPDAGAWGTAWHMLKVGGAAAFKKRRA
ncbi:MAG: 2,4-dienoyl-CoA reductase, partial [Myxococcales bacterium]|nr:2,4-dienoyl-CoA reductase [Myxococcales bacterium]